MYTGCMRNSLAITVTLSALLVGCTAAPDVVFTAPQDTAPAPQEEIADDHDDLAEESLVPESVQIRMTFVPQAPFANWDEAHGEACEEMSLILVHHYLKGTPLSFEQAEQELQALLKWETENGYDIDVTAEEVAQIARDYYGHEAKAVSNITIDDIKKEVAQGNPVIVPAAGRKLGNPYFSGAGPWYHMLVVTGFDNDEFVTHDVGTKRGENYRYDQHVFFDAIHDWTGVKEEIEKGPKAMVVVVTN